VSHLGEFLSALVDGELTGAELDRANAHLAACEQCRAEATALRDLKRQLRGLAAAAGPGIATGTENDQTPTRDLDEALTERLLAMAGPGGRQASRRLRRDAGRPRAAFRVYSGGPRRPDGMRRAGSRPASSRPGGARPGQAWSRPGPQRPGPGHTQRLIRPLVLQAETGQRSRVRGGRLRLRPRGWYLIWSAVSLVVVGIGTAAFSMGGGAATPGPKVTPQVEMFSVEHAITSGDVPIPDPTAQVPTAEPTP
jgi:putative zinc finger protein